MQEFNYDNEPGKVLIKRPIKTDGIPLVSIITPFYNAGKHFEQTYNCVINQTFPWFEWIIVNDGSTNQSDLNLLLELAKTDIRIKVIDQANKGASAARNTAIFYSTTDIIIPLDADDLITPTYLDLLYWGLEFNPKATWSYTDSIGFGAQQYVWKKPFVSDVLKHENFLVCTAAIKKKELQDVGCFLAEKKYFYEDWYVWLQLVAKNKFPVHINQNAFWYRRNETGVLATVEGDNILKKEADEEIQKVAKEIIEPVTAVEFPRTEYPNKFLLPKMSSFNQKVYSTHDKTRILLLLPWMVMGGADLFNLDIVKKLDKEAFDVSIITTETGESTWRNRFEEYCLDIFELPTFLEQSNFAEFISYIIKSREIDVLFVSNSYYGYYLIPWLRKHFPNLAIVDYVHMEEWYWRNGGYARTSSVMGELSEKTYVCNERTRNVLIRDFGRRPESVETLYIGVDAEIYNKENVPYGKMRASLNISEERPIILFPCRMHPQKRPFLMLEIARKVREKIPNIAFVVAGDGEQLNELIDTANNFELQGTVFFAGRIDDMKPYYRDSQITLICSLKEGLALTAYESLAMGVPVVSSDVGGQGELIDNTVGRLIPLHQCEESDLDNRDFNEEEITLYVKAICELLDTSNYNGYSLAARERIINKFSNKIMIEKLQHIFHDLRVNTDIASKRRQLSQELNNCGLMAEDYLTVYTEITNRDTVYREPVVVDPNLGITGVNLELLRMAKSKWGQRLIKFIFRFKLNKLF